ncbi:MAG: cation:proton antiporter [Burkholderiaceae bacterium]
MVVTLVGVALLFGLALSRIGLPPMVGFLLAGFAYNLAGLAHPDALTTIADLGVTMLLFTIGLKLDLKALANSEVWGASLAHIAVSTLVFSGSLFLAQALFPLPILDISPTATVVMGFVLSFSSTVFAVKTFEEKGDLTTFYGKVAIGILVMQDIFAVVFLAITEGSYPAPWAVLVLLLPWVRRPLFRILDAAGHGELLVLSGLFFALGLGYELFSLAGLKGDLGALVLGALLANHPKAGELSKALFSFKELMLVGFFLSVGMEGLPSWELLGVAALICLLLPVKTLLYHVVISQFRLRVRTSVLVSLSLATYSEFSLIVAAIGVKQGWLPVPWLLITALCISLSFAAAAPFNKHAETIYQRFKRFWEGFTSSHPHPRDRILQTGDARVLVIGMGRVGSGAYDQLASLFEGHILGIEHNPERVDAQRDQGRNVLLGDATDSDFWLKLSAGKEMELILLAMPNHSSNVYAAHQIRNVGLQGTVVAIAKYSDEVQELAQLQVPAFNMYSQAGEGLARQALEVLGAQKDTPV